MHTGPRTRPRMASPRRLWRCMRGANAVEFALIAPVMLLLGMGTIELSAYLRAARAVADLTGSVAVAIGDIDRITGRDIRELEVAVAGASGYLNRDRLTIEIHAVTMQDNRPVTQWRRRIGNDHDGPKSTAIGETARTLATRTLDDGQSALIVESRYAYHDVIGGGFLADTTITRTFIAFPKNDETTLDP